MMNADAECEGEPEVLVLDGGADALHLWLGHVEPLLVVVLGGQEGDQVQRRQSGLPPYQQRSQLYNSASIGTYDLNDFLTQTFNFIIALKKIISPNS